MKKVVVSHSGGKDSMLALHRMIEQDDVEVVRILTTVNENFQRSSIHGIREELLELQAEYIGIPLQKVYLPKITTNEEYERLMSDAFREIEQDGISHIVFGDINLLDVREFREKQLEGINLEAIFPLWNEPTHELIHEFIELGYETLITTIDPKRVPDEFLGANLDHNMYKKLPEEVDPCGENGEFHTFVVNGPLFNKRLPVKFGTKVVEEEFYKYQDVVRVKE
ncbi:Dph6-related ATP pyrophosphatase [Alkalibacillus aidingensis]|uniref:Dph6-related ATP pyrophosphatase n=1 Tax=Alkalibacillus aidingensis TaxID=2747607 RepID=UPI00166065CA|nr:diphthine--ammonia ligase [Alkalibacillus aidingensis]